MYEHECRKAKNCILTRSLLMSKDSCTTNITGKDLLIDKLVKMYVLKFFITGDICPFEFVLTLNLNGLITSTLQAENSSLLFVTVSKFFLLLFQSLFYLVVLRVQYMQQLHSILFGS